MGDVPENSNVNADLPKLPFKRLKHPLNQVVTIAIPLHVQRLKDHIETLQSLKIQNRELELRYEQVKASKTVQLLKADLHELENLNAQVREEDIELFSELILKPTKDVIEILSLFMELHSDVLAPFPGTDDSFDCTTNNIVPLVCKYEPDTLDEDYESKASVAAVQLEGQAVLTSKRSFDAWSYLQRELVEINALMKQFAKLVFRQKESVDTIEDNVEHTNENVYLGTKYLKKASDYKAATFPIAGAVIGGLILGPAGALVGFKLLGSVACLASGSVLGYGAGLKLKEKQKATSDIEMKAIAYPTKSKSQSTPDLSVAEPEEQS